MGAGVRTSWDARHRLGVVAVSLLVLPAFTPAVFGQDDTASAAAAFRARGLEHGYNLDYSDALAAFRQSIAIDPDDADAHRLAAATTWMQLLFEQGAITVEDYLGQVRATIGRRAPRPELVSAFHHHVERASVLAEERVRQHPDDPDAHFQLGAAAALRASYISTIEGRVLDSISAARHAYSEHRRSLALDPTRRDAELIVGLYRYGVASLSFPLRLLARLAGLDANRASGIRSVESAAEYPSYTRTNARFALVLLYNREGRHRDAWRIVQQLRQDYPRNRLLLLEAGSTALRAGQVEEAVDALSEGIARLDADPRPRAYGEEARWRYQRGAAFAESGDADAAARDLHAALALEAPPWIRGRVHLELGKLADLAGDQATARARYGQAVADCRAGRDAACADAVTRLMSRQHR